MGRGLTLPLLAHAAAEAAAAAMWWDEGYQGAASEQQHRSAACPSPRSPTLTGALRQSSAPVSAAGDGSVPLIASSLSGAQRQEGFQSRFYRQWRCLGTAARAPWHGDGSMEQPYTKNKLCCI